MKNLKNYLSLFDWIHQQYFDSNKKQDRREPMQFGDDYSPADIKGKTVKNWFKKKYERKKKL
jgi:hypothetical protein